MTKIKIDFIVGRMTQYILIKPCIYIVFTSFLTLKSMDDNKNTDCEFHQYLYVDRQGLNHRHREKKSHLSTCEISLTYIGNNSGPKIEP